MNDYAKEQWGDADDRILSHVKEYGGMTGYDVDGNQWTLRTYYGEDSVKGFTLITIKGVKLWYELRLKADLPPLPAIPPFPIEEGI